MSYEAEKILLAQKILEVGREMGFPNMNSIIKEAKLEWKIIGRLSKGKGNPTLETLLKVADALNVNIDELFKIHKKPKTVKSTELDDLRDGRRLLN